MVLVCLEDQLFDESTLKGLVLLSPGPVESGTGMDLMAVAPTVQETRERLGIAEALLTTPVRSRASGDFGSGAEGLVHRFRSSMTYSHAATASSLGSEAAQRATRRSRSRRVNFHSKGRAIC